MLSIKKRPIEKKSKEAFTGKKAKNSLKKAKTNNTDIITEKKQRD